MRIGWVSEVSSLSPTVNPAQTYLLPQKLGHLGLVFEVEPVFLSLVLHDEVSHHERPDRP
jgi:hypothetical protein